MTKKTLANVDDFLQMLDESDDQKSKHKILTEAVMKLFNAVGPDDILRIKSKNVFYFQDRELSESEVHQIREEATVLRESKLWTILQKDLQYQANNKMFLKSETALDLMAGKLLLWYIDVIDSRLKKL